jgi:hypothetical protein
MLSEAKIVGQEFERVGETGFRIGDMEFAECELEHLWPQNDPRRCDLCFCGFEADPWEKPEDFELTRTLFVNEQGEFICSDCLRKYVIQPAS